MKTAIKTVKKKWIHWFRFRFYTFSTHTDTKHTVSCKRNDLNFAALADSFMRIKRLSVLIVGSLRQPLKQINSSKMVTMLPAGRVLEQLLELSHILGVPAGLRFPWMGMNMFEPLPPGSM